MSSVSLAEKSLRLRYEAFSKFADDLSKARNWDEIGQALATNLKFILDIFIFRLSLTRYHERLTFIVFRGKAEHTLFLVDELTPWELTWEKDGLPLSLGKAEIEQYGLADTIFGNPKIQEVFVLPFRFTQGESAVMIAANKNETPYKDNDYRFFRLISELLATKISQSFLLKTIEVQNQQLAEINEEVVLMNNNLEEIVGERTQKLQEANQELNTLFYRTSHDFRRPLSAIMGLVGLAEICVEDQTALDLFRRCADTVREMDRMLVKLSSISTVEQLEFQRIDFEALFADLQQQFQPLLTAKQIYWESQISLDTEFYSDLRCLKDILSNLVENAVHFSSLSQPPYISLSVGRKDYEVFISTKDNGQGIEESCKTQIFDMYFRGSEHSKGNGLGLYVVRKLVEKLGGAVHFESQQHQGSLFTLSFYF